MAPFCHSIRSENKTNRRALRQQHEFTSTGSLDCFCRLSFVERLVWIWFYDAALQTAL